MYARAKANSIGGKIIKENQVKAPIPKITPNVVPTTPNNILSIDKFLKTRFISGEITNKYWVKLICL